MLVLAVAMAPMWWWRMKVQRSPHRDNGEFHQFYVHRHQTGNNNKLVVSGSRRFELLNPAGIETPPHGLSRAKHGCSAHHGRHIVIAPYRASARQPGAEPVAPGCIVFAMLLSLVNPCKPSRSPGVAGGPRAEALGLEFAHMVTSAMTTRARRLWPLAVDSRRRQLHPPQDFCTRASSLSHKSYWWYLLRPCVGLRYPPPRQAGSSSFCPSHSNRGSSDDSLPTRFRRPIWGDPPGGVQLSGSLAPGSAPLPPAGGGSPLRGAGVCREESRAAPEGASGAAALA